MTVGRLNVDVLTLICDCLTDVSHILSFALTCSALHAVAIRRLLSMRPIYLRGSDSIRRFHSFVSADKPARARHIRALEIGIRSRPSPREPPEATPAHDDPLLIDILNWCPHLESISVVLRAAGPPVTDGPSISDMIADIQSLRSLSIHGKFKDPVAFLQRVHAPLRMLSIQCSGPNGTSWSAASLEKILPRFAPTLEQLELTTFFSYPNETKATISTPSRSVFTLPQYPNVRSFSVAQLQGMPSLVQLQHLFPALDGTLSLYLFGVWAKENRFPAVRAANQRAQDRSDSAKEQSSRAWSKLACVACSVHMFYVLGLRCPIGLLMLDRVTKYTKRYLVEALREQPVPRLELSLVLGDGLAVFEGLFPQELGARLTHLTLFCENGYYDSVDSVVEAAASARRHWGDLVNKMRQSLERLHGLTHLRVVFHCVHHNRGILPDAVCNYKYNHLCIYGGPIFARAEETAASLARTLPSLEYVFLTAIGHLKTSVDGLRGYERWHSEQAWRVDRETKDGKPVLVELHDEVAETIIRKEELVLSKADEAALSRYEG